MNIWLFNHYAVPPWLYPLARPYNFAKYLIKDDHNVTIFAASTVHNSDKNLITNKDKYKIEDIDNINYVYIKASNYKSNGLDRIKNMVDYFLRIFKISKIIGNKFSKPDIIIASSVHPLTCIAGILIAKRFKVKCIVEIADLWPLTLVELGKLDEKSIIAKVMYLLEHWIYKKADSIIFTMEGGKNYIKDKGWHKDINLSKVYHINNGVDIEVFESQVKENTYKDQDLEDDNFFKVIYTGSIGRANAVNYIIDSAKAIKDSGNDDIKYLIYGDGYLRSEYEKYCSDNMVTNVVFKGKVDKKYIPYILSKGNINILTGQNNNLYNYGVSLNKMFDYLASGKPIISNIECNYNILKQYNCGILVKNNDVDDLVKGIFKLYNLSNEVYNEYCNNSKNLANEYDFKALTKKLERVIVNTINNNQNN